jgi:LacI family transcriptional regulator
LIPAHQEGDYWHSVAQGIEKAAIELRPFNVSVEFIYYVHAHESSYSKGCDALRNMEIDAALIAPNFEKETTELAVVLQTRKVPTTLMIFNIEGARALKYIGLRLAHDGYKAAKLLKQSYREGQKLVLFLVNGKNIPPRYNDSPHEGSCST